MSTIWLVFCLWPQSRAAEDFAGSTYYFGDLHAHTGVSPDGGASDLGNCIDNTCGNLADVFQIARENGLDFLALTDHTTSDRIAFNDLLAATLAANDPAGGFVTIPAAELKFTGDDGHLYGHKNGFSFEDDDDALAALSLGDFHEAISVAECSEVWAKADVLAAYGPALLFAHHPATAATMPTDWGCHDQTYEPVVEVYSEHGSSLVDDGDYDPVELPVHESTVHEALETYGLKVGFVGGSDNHDTHPGEVCALDAMHPSFPYGAGVTIVQVDSGAAFDRGAIYDEMVARRTLASTGPHMPVQIEWTLPSGLLAGPGEELSVRACSSSTLTVSVPSGWVSYVTAVSAVGYDDKIPLTGDGTGTWTATIANEDLGRWRYVAVEIDGELYYGTDCVDGPNDDHREFVWGSPDWFDLVDDLDGDGAGCAADCDDADPLLFPGAVEIECDGIDQDCDGTNDLDFDADGRRSIACGGMDCDDFESTIYPGAKDVWYDGIDADCDGADDFDQDADGSESASYGGTDCDDTDPDIFVGAMEIWYDGIDENCVGWSDYDRDGDLVEAFDYGGADCDDRDETVHPGATEIWYDGTDQNCDWQSDFDQDGDGEEPLAFGGTDCDDENVWISTWAEEIWYDGIDEDCDGSSDFDQDGDGDEPAEFDGTDCDDENPAAHPGADEIWYDSVDESCDGGSDLDQDSDGHDLREMGGDDCDDLDPQVVQCADPEWGRTGCGGCGAIPSRSTSGLWIVALSALVVRRRR